MRRIWIDADGCPVWKIVLQLAEKKKVPVVLVTDTAHVFPADCQVITVDQGRDSVDMKLANLVKPGDLVVTQDYGVAAMALSRGAEVVNQNGMVFHNGNINQLLWERHLGQKLRRSGQKEKMPRGTAKRTKADDDRFRLWLNSWLSPP